MSDNVEEPVVSDVVEEPAVTEVVEDVMKKMFILMSLIKMMFLNS